MDKTCRICKYLCYCMFCIFMLQLCTPTLIQKLEPEALAAAGCKQQPVLNTVRDSACPETALKVEKEALKLAKAVKKMWKLQFATECLVIPIKPCTLLGQAGLIILVLDWRDNRDMEQGNIHLDCRANGSYFKDSKLQQNAGIAVRLLCAL